MRKSGLLNAIALMMLMCSTTGMADNLLISNINRPATNYDVKYNSLAVGQGVYTDRSFTFNSVPVSLQGETYIMTANNDKYSTGDSFLTFESNLDCTVYVAHDDRITVKPSWMSAFTDSNLNLEADTTLSLYYKDFGANTTIELGGNAGGVSSSMYSVVIVPIASTAPDAATNPNPGNNAVGVSSRGTILSWTKGTGATSHDVYFGDANPPAFIRNQTEMTCDSGALNSNTIYYWRIDEVNAYGTTAGTVWSFTTGTPTIWPMDDDEANVIVTESIAGYHGTFSDATGDANTNAHHSTDCKEGTGSLSFDGIDDYVEISGYKGISGGSSRTCTAWIKTATPNTEFLSWGSMDTGGKWLILLDDAGKLRAAINGGSITGSTVLTDNQWHHIAVVLGSDGSSDISKAVLYVDGHTESISSSASYSVNTGNLQNVQIGLCQVQAAYRYFQGLIDDVRIYDYALSADEIYHVQYPKNAWNPSPVHSALLTRLTGNLNWSAGEGAISHDVYFGTSENAVTNAQRPAGDVNGDGSIDITDLSILVSQWLTNPGAVNPSGDIEFNESVDLGDFAKVAETWGQAPDTAFKGNQVETSFDAGALTYGATYYWRIDEVNSTDPQSPYKGHVWEFTNTEPIIEIMPLGDSITQGWPGINYRYYLWNQLVAAGHTNLDFVGSLALDDSSSGYDNNHEGHFGWTDYSIATNVYGWLQLNPPDIILLHIGTNGLEESPADVETILDEIDRYENTYNHPIKVVLAKIINRNFSVPASQREMTTTFNNNVAAMAQARINNEGDDIVIIDMENGAGMDYSADMYDELHPNASGYQKIAALWFTALQTILPE